MRNFSIQQICKLNVPSITMADPPTKPTVISTPNTIVVKMDDITTARVVAITFIMISEYLAEETE